MLRTKGYFNSNVNIQDHGESYTVNVTPGPRTKVDNVSVAILGDVLNDDNLAEYYQNAMENWQQPVGENFDQDGWSASKTSVLSAVTRKKYPLAKLTTTQATINPNTQKADLNVIVESNRPIYFGDFQITGTRRYPESVVSGMARFQPGSPYDLDKILDLQQALEQNGHYSGASVQADFDQLQGDRVPIKINVTEVKRHKLETGIRYDSEYGIGGRIAYDYYNLFNKGYIGSIVWDMDKYETTLAAGISQPRNNRGNYWTSNVSYNRSTTQNLEKRALSSGIWYVRDRNNIDARFGLEFITEDRKVPDTSYDLGRSHATMLTASWKRQSIETELHPQNGYYLDGKIGTTLGKLLSSTQMARATARAGYFFTPENKKTRYVHRTRTGRLCLCPRRRRSAVQPDVPHRRRDFCTRLRTRQHRLGRPQRLRPAATRLGGRQPRISIPGHQKLLRRHLPRCRRCDKQLQTHDLKTRYRLGRTLVQPGCAVLLRHCLRPSRQENPLAHQLRHKVLTNIHHPFFQMASAIPGRLNNRQTEKYHDRYCKHFHAV